MAAAVVAVACSGGRDSVALLHATVQAAAQVADLRVVALHVHHGLHPQADQWLKHVEQLCARWSRRGLPVGFAGVCLEGKPPAGSSVEAWARVGRYRALAQMARDAGAHLVLLAHHRRDQAETFLLQALRGASSAGLAGMPREVQRDGLTWARPWLRHSRAAIETYVRRHRLTYVDDASNANPRFARNRLRQLVWPTLVDAFEQAEAALADAAERAAESRQLADEVATEDLSGAVDDDGRLQIAAWLRLSPRRRSNSLLAWLRERSTASASLLQRLLAELPSAASGACWPAGTEGKLRLHRGRLELASVRRRDAAVGQRVERLCIAGIGRFPLPGWGGTLDVSATQRGGVAAERLLSLRVVAREGGEQFQMTPKGTPRSLKKQYQSRGVPAWNREGPLLYDGARLLYVPGLGIDAREWAPDRDAQVLLQWLPDDTSPPATREGQGRAEN